ncbi:MAG TPA: hypothetical protein VGE76_00820 [Opitutaceae bacterium]
METAASELRRAREVLGREIHRETWDYAQLADQLCRLAVIFERVSEEGRRELTAQFHDMAGRLPVVLDADFGALVLEELADSVSDRPLKRWLYTEAGYRANWCVQSGTAGGECLARVVHVQRIEAKLKKA